MAQPIWMALSIWIAAVTADQQERSNGRPNLSPHAHVTVNLRDGRSITGTIDPDTDQNLLWLRIVAPGIVLTTSMSWNDVTMAQDGNRVVSVEELRQLAFESKSKPTIEFYESREGVPPSVSVGPAKTPRIRYLDVDANVANWDSDLEFDGLELRIYPRTSRSELRPVHGMLNVRLIGCSLRGPGRRALFPEIGRWSKRVRREDFGISGAVFQLPFQRVNPQVDLEFGAYGQVLVQLGITGQGRFDTSVAVRLRTRSPLRDKLELLERRRLFRLVPRRTLIDRNKGNESPSF